MEDKVIFVFSCFFSKSRYFSFAFLSFIRTFNFVEGTCTRKSKRKNELFLLLFSHLFVPLYVE